MLILWDIMYLLYIRSYLISNNIVKTPPNPLFELKRGKIPFKECNSPLFYKEGLGEFINR